MRVIFAGTPEFARVAVERIHAAGHTVALVLTQPDRPAGRGMKLQASAVKQWAQQAGVPVAQPRSLRLDGRYPQDAQAARLAIDAAQAQVMVVAAYGLILPQWVLDAMAGPGQCGALNIHGSLLPRWRGAAPIHRAIEAGDAATGVTIMQMDAGLDTGDMLALQSLPIALDDTTASLHDKLAALGAAMIVDALAAAEAGRLQAQPQPAVGVTYAHKIEKHEAALDWTADAATLARRVRAFNPFPGASFTVQGETIKAWRAEALALEASGTAAPPGALLAATPLGLDVATSRGTLRLLEVRRPGAKRLPVAEFVRGFTLLPGAMLAGSATEASPDRS